MTTTPADAPTTGPGNTDTSILASAIAASLENATEDEIM